MYNALDSFLNIPTWHTRHPNDEERFFCALRSMVLHPGFHPDMMGEYIDTKLDLTGLAEDHAYRKARNHYVAAAWAVKRFREANC